MRTPADLVISMLVLCSAAGTLPAQAWSATLSAGPAWRIEGRSAGPTLGSVTVSAHRGSGVARLGLELGYHRYEAWDLDRPGIFYFDPATETEYLCPPDCSVGIPTTARDGRSGSAVQATVQLRLQGLGEGPRPYATVGLGGYAVRAESRWSRRDASGTVIQRLPSRAPGRALAGGGNVGLGVLVPLGRGWGLDVGGRLHGFALVGDDYVGGEGFGALMLGIVRR